jgi:hypothetical protein
MVTLEDIWSIQKKIQQKKNEELSQEKWDSELRECSFSP